jgi:hypothetical protein
MTLPIAKRIAKPQLILVVTLALLGLGLTIFFGLRAYSDYRQLQLRGNPSVLTDVEELRGWMTIPYVAKAYQVPEDALYEALGIPKAGNDTLSLQALVSQHKLDPTTTRQKLQQVIVRYQPTPAPQPRATP